MLKIEGVGKYHRINVILANIVPNRMITSILTEAVFVTLALLFYGIANITVQRFKLAMSMVLWLMSIALVFHLVAIFFMLFVNESSPSSLPAFLSYTACFALIVDYSITWKVRLRDGENAVLSKRSLLISKAAFGWWIISFVIAGILLIK